METIEMFINEMMKPTIAAIVLLFSVPIIASGDFSEGTVNFQKILQLANEQNPELRVIRYQIEMAEARSLDAGRLSNPVLGVSASSDEFFNNEGEYGWSVSLAQNFPITHRLRTSRQLAKEEIQLAKAEIRVAEAKLKYRVEELWNALIVLNFREKVLQKHFELSDDLKQFIQDKIQKAEGSEIELNQAKLEGFEIQQEMARLEREVQSVLDRLKQLCGIAGEEKLAIDYDGFALSTDLKPWQDSWLESHPEYQLKEQLLLIASYESDMALASRWSDLTIEIFYEEGYGKDEPIGYERERFIGVGLSLPLPVFDTKRGTIRESRLKHMRLEQELESTRFHIRSEAESLRRRSHEIQHSLELYESETLTMAEKNYQSVEAAYRAGLIDLEWVFRERERSLKVQGDYLKLKQEQVETQTRWGKITAQ